MSSMETTEALIFGIGYRCPAQDGKPWFVEMELVTVLTRSNGDVEVTVPKCPGCGKQHEMIFNPE
jgi:hypothetical protein